MDQLGQAHVAGPRRMCVSGIPGRFGRSRLTLELVSQSLVAGIDSILGVLDAHAGGVQGERHCHRIRRTGRQSGVRRAATPDQGADRCRRRRRWRHLIRARLDCCFRRLERARYRGRREPTASFRAISPGVSAIARSASASSPRAISASRASRGETPERRGPW